MSDAVNYFEIGTPDAAATQAFFAEVFGWRFAPGTSPEYRFVNGTAGGLWDTSESGGGSWAVFYIDVPDIAATLAAAQAAGARVVMPLVDNGAILFAHLEDRAGHRFGVWQRRGA